MSPAGVLLRLCARAGLVAWLAISPGFAQDGIRVLNAEVQYPEGPAWYQGKLYYVDYGRNAVMVWDGEKNSVFSTAAGCGQSAVVPTARGEFLTTCYDNGTIGRMAADGTTLPPYTHDSEGRVFLGPNDFAPDNHGGIYFSASGAHGDSIDGKVFYIDAQGAISLKADDLHNPNGLALSRDGTSLYVVETDENRLLTLTIGPGGSLSERKILVNLDDLVQHAAHIWPDGVKVDSRGQIYIGQSAREYGAAYAGVIFVVNAGGKLLRQLTLPSLQVPNFAFSPDEKTLYVTAVEHFDKPPYRGKLYSIPNR